MKVFLKEGEYVEVCTKGLYGYRGDQIKVTLQPLPEMGTKIFINDQPFAIVRDEVMELDLESAFGQEILKNTFVKFLSNLLGPPKAD